MTHAPNTHIVFEDSVYVGATIVHGITSDPKFLPTWLRAAQAGLTFETEGPGRSLDELTAPRPRNLRPQ